MVIIKTDKTHEHVSKIP